MKNIIPRYEKNIIPRYEKNIIPRYEENLTKVTEEIKIRKDRGLIANNSEEYINQLKNNFPKEYEFIVNLNTQLPKEFISKTTKLVINIPVAWFWNQENENIKQTIKLLSEDKLFKEWKVKLLIFSNRPEGRDWDETKKNIENYIESLWIQKEAIWVIEWDIPKNLWRIDWPFNDETAKEDNQVPIWFIRDVMNITVAIQSKWMDFPILQMDWDFYGFEKWWLENIIDIFSKNKCTFLQCKSNWDWNIKTADIPLLKFWSDLMAELPMILKEKINEDISNESLGKIVFSDAIQRWIQVPQVELLSQITKKWWYWLLRLSCDELDLNMRSAFLLKPNWLKSTWDLTFLRDNRRAIATLLQYNIPPISQRKNWFEADDKVRWKQNLNTNLISFTKENILNTLNLTLDKFVIPEKINWVYDNWEEAIIVKLEELGIYWNYYKIVEKELWLIKLQLNNISNWDFNFLKWKYNGK